MALESLEAAAAAGTAGMSDTPPSEDASPCVVIMLASDVKLWAVEPACVAKEHRSSAGPLAAAAVPRGRTGRDPPLVMLLVSFAAAPRLPVLLMWLIEPVGGREMSAGPLLGPTLSDAAPASVPMLLVE